MDELHQDGLKKRMNSSYSSKPSRWKTARAARNGINSVPQTAATTVAFSSVCILLPRSFVFSVVPGGPVYPEVGLELIKYEGGDVLHVVEVLVAAPALVGRQLNIQYHIGRNVK